MNDDFAHWLVEWVVVLLPFAVLTAILFSVRRTDRADAEPTLELAPDRFGRLSHHPATMDAVALEAWNDGELWPTPGHPIPHRFPEGARVIAETDEDLEDFAIDARLREHHGLPKRCAPMPVSAVIDWA